MARTLTPAEWAELERAQREGGIPNVAPDSSMRFEGDMQLRPAPERELQGYPRGGVGGLLDRVGAGIQEDVGQVRDWAGGLLGRETTGLPAEEQPEWMSPEDTESAQALERETGVPASAIQFFQYYKQAFNSGGREAAQEVFDRFWPYLSPGDREALNQYLYGVK